jgi:hypothetical protein
MEGVQAPVADADASRELYSGVPALKETRWLLPRLN